MIRLKRELYMEQSCPLLERNRQKSTGLRRSGKSVMLDLVKNELKEHEIPEENFITFGYIPFQCQVLHGPRAL